jgi:hypothetical protein
VVKKLLPAKGGDEAGTFGDRAMESSKPILVRITTRAIPLFW